MSKKTIVKIQRPIHTNRSPAVALVYSQDRSIEVEVLLSDVEEFFIDNELKVYHKAHLNDQGNLVIDTRCKKQRRKW